MRFAPAALVRRNPRRAPSGFIIGTTRTSARESRAVAMGSAWSRSLRRKPSIHQDAWDSPGCCRAMNHRESLFLPSGAGAPRTVIISMSAPSSVCPIVAVEARGEDATKPPMSCM